MKDTKTIIPKKPKDCVLTCRNISLCEHGCIGYEEELGNNAEPIREYPDDPMDLAKEKFIDEYMKGEN